MAPLLVFQRTDLAHSKLDDAMFWVGALFVFTPIVVAVCVFGYMYWHKRRRGPEPPAKDD